MEGGIIGLVSLGLVVAAVAIGSRGRPAPLFALAALALFALMTLTDNPSARPNLAVLAIAWAAYAVPRSEVQAALDAGTRRSTWTAVATGVAGVFVALSVSSTIAAAGAFEQARVALREGDLAGARESLDAAVDLDPGMTLYLRERGVRAAEAGEVESGIADLQRAAQMNPADATAQRALAILLARAGALQTGLAHAQAALELGEEQAENALTLAHVADIAGDDTLRHDALTDALAADPYLAGAPTWPTMFPTGTDLDELLAAALPLRLASLDDRGRHEYPEAWLPAATSSPPLAGAGAGLLAIDAVIRCELQAAGEILASAPAREVNGVVGLTARIMLGQVTGDTAEVQRARDLARLWRNPLVDLTVDVGSPASPFSDPAEDVRLYERNPLPPPAMAPLLPTMEEGLAAWLQDPQGAARRGAPASALAHCRSG
jgi:tetratricopeptide (TPR) repeat protein